jgi:hypothetical protein
MSHHRCHGPADGRDHGHDGYDHDGHGRHVDEALAKVHFTLDDEPSCREALWAVAVGGDSYRIANVPFFVRHAGLHDTVIALPVGNELEFVAVTERRCVASFGFVVDADGDTTALLARLDALGACSEGIEGVLFATNLHDPAAVDAVHRLLFDECEWVERFDQDGSLVARFERR